jgi:rod shape-determining protein MreB and related proteins
MTENAFLLGLDFGSFKTSIVASNGRRETIRTAVGRPRDHIARALLGTDFVFGERLAEVEMAVDIVRPFAHGALKYGAGEAVKDHDARGEAARLVLKHVLSLVEPPANVPIYAVIGSPSRATIENKRILTESARGIFDCVAIVAEPFAIAYGMKQLMGTLVVDIGAGTTDLCPLYGTYPRDEDQVTIARGGDSIDEDFLQRLRAAHPAVQVTADMVRDIKDRHGFVHDVNETAVVTLPVNGVPTSIDVTELLKQSCRTIVPPIVEGIRQIIARTHPRFQQQLLQNIVLGGGGSQLNGLDTLIEEGLAPIGGGKVTKVHDSVYAGAAGALRLAMSMPPSSWQRISQAKAAA